MEKLCVPTEKSWLRPWYILSFNKISFDKTSCNKILRNEATFYGLDRFYINLLLKRCPRLLVLQRVAQNAKSCSKVAEHNLFMPTAHHFPIPRSPFPIPRSPIPRSPIRRSPVLPFPRSPVSPFPVLPLPVPVLELASQKGLI